MGTIFLPMGNIAEVVFCLFLLQLPTNFHQDFKIVVHRTVITALRTPVTQSNIQMGNSFDIKVLVYKMPKDIRATFKGKIYNYT